MSSNEKALKSGVWYTISNFLLKGIDFITIPIFARLMSKTEYGLYSNYISWLQIVLVIGSLYLFPSLYSARYDYENKIENYIRTILLIGSTAALIEMIFVIIFSSYFESLFSTNCKFILLMFVYAMVRPAFEVFLVTERIKYNYKKSIGVSAIAAVSSISISLLLVLLFEDKYQARILGTYIPLVFLCALLYIHYMRNSSQFEQECGKYALKIGLPYVPHALAMIVLSSTDRIMITHYCGASDTALYSLAYTCALGVTVLWSSVNTAFAPWLGEKIHNHEYVLIHDFSSKYVFVVAVPVVGLILLAPEILFVLGGNQYVDAKFVIPPIMAGCFIQFIYSMYVDIEQFLKKTGGMAIASVLGALLNLGLNYVFIPIYGYTAAAYTTLCGYLFLLIIHYFLVSNLEMTHIYNKKTIICSLLFMLIISVITLYLYSYNILRYAIVGVYLILFVLIFNRFNVKAMLRK